MNFEEMLADGSIRDTMAGGVPAVEAMNFNSVSINAILGGVQGETNAKRGSRV
jgi:hypothetical protein